jgi:hypothetical protein
MHARSDELQKAIEIMHVNLIVRRWAQCQATSSIAQQSQGLLLAIRNITSERYAKSKNRSTPGSFDGSNSFPQFKILTESQRSEGENIILSNHSLATRKRRNYIEKYSRIRGKNIVIYIYINIHTFRSIFSIAKSFHLLAC